MRRKYKNGDFFFIRVFLSFFLRHPVSVLHRSELTSEMGWNLGDLLWKRSCFFQSALLCSDNVGSNSRYAKLQMGLGERWK